MKKQLLFTVLFISALSLSAQDTVREGDSVYMFNPHDTLIAFGHLGYDNAINSGNVIISYRFPQEISQAYHTDTAIWLYGIAVTIDNFSSPADSIHFRLIDSLRKENCFMTTLHQQDMETGQLRLIDTVGWKFPVMERKFEYACYFFDSNSSYYNYGDTVRNTCRCIEFYFDSPRQVYDTFYVGTIASYTNNNKDECFYGNVEHSVSFFNRSYYSWSTNSTSKWILFQNNDIHSQPTNIEDDYWYNSLSSFADSYNHTNSGPWGYVFPILYPRMDGCTAPARPWLVDKSCESATFEWEQSDDELQLVVSPDYNGMPDTMSGVVTIAAGSTGYTATGLEADTYYGVWVRRRCHWITPTFDTAVWSPWSHVVLFNTSSAGIRGVDDVAFSLFPNPATDAFTVETPALDSRLTLFDIRGTELYSVDIRSTRTTIGIADLPTGVYFVSLTSPTGTTSKRLAIDRH